ncbi:MAG TPA: hypothetical protein EYH49_03770 [Aquifex aeolicus]|nr:hypothetical protein [Aquifex aeolicus]
MRKALALLGIFAGVSFGGEKALIVKEETAQALNSLGCECRELGKGVYYCKKTEQTRFFLHSHKPKQIEVYCGKRFSESEKTILLPIHSIIGISY